MRHPWQALLAFFTIILLSGCGSSGFSNDVAGSPDTSPGLSPPGGGSHGGKPPVPTGTLRIESLLEAPLARSIRAQMVPTEAEQLRFTGLTANNEAVYGPETRMKAAVIELENVPVTVVKLQVEYLAQDQVIGVARSEVSVVPNQVTAVPEESFVELEITIASLTLTPTTSSRAAGESLQYQVLGVLTDGTSLDLTALVDWSTSDTSIARSSPRGMVTTLAEGSVTITASRNGISGSSTLDVGPPTVVGVDVSPAALTIPVGSNTPLSATLILTNGSRVPSTDVSWSVAQSSIATVSPSGTITAVSEGTTVVTVASGNFFAQVEVTVLPAGVKLERLSVTPVSVGIRVNTGIELTTTAHYSDGTELAANRLVTWTSSNRQVASMESNGYLYGVSVGTATIAAELDGLTVAIPVTVIPQPPHVTTFSIEPGEVNLHLQETLSLQPVTRYSDGSWNVPTGVIWTSSDSSLVTVDSSGQVTALRVGSATVSANVDGMLASVEVTVVPKLLSLSITPTSATTPLGVPFQFTLTGHYEDSSTRDLTQQAIWSSSDITISAIDSGQASSQAMGSVTITAQIQELSATASLEVADGVLLDLWLFPTNFSSLHENGTHQLQLLGNYSHIDPVDLTDIATWESSDADVLTVSATGVVTAVHGAGGQSATITARYSDLTVSQTIEVPMPTPSGLGLNISALSMSTEATTFQVTAYILMSNGDEIDVTADALWSSSDTSVFVVPTAPQISPSPGTVIRVGPGEASLTVSHGGSQISIPVYVVE